MAPEPGLPVREGRRPAVRHGPVLRHHARARPSAPRRACRPSRRSRSTAAPSRPVTVPARRFPVEVPTHHAALIEFAGGLSAQSTFSFQHALTPYGLRRDQRHARHHLAPDPNTFEGSSQLWRHGQEEPETLEAVGSPGAGGTGVVELARAIAEDRPERASGEVALHVLDVLLGIPRRRRSPGPPSRSSRPSSGSAPLPRTSTPPPRSSPPRWTPSNHPHHHDGRSPVGAVRPCARWDRDRGTARGTTRRRGEQGRRAPLQQAVRRRGRPRRRWGIEGDAHAAGTTVQHRSRVARDPSQPNLRQVHLGTPSCSTSSSRTGHHVAPGELGENVTTRGVATCSGCRPARSCTSARTQGAGDRICATLPADQRPRPGTAPPGNRDGPRTARSSGRAA